MMSIQFPIAQQKTGNFDAYLSYVNSLPLLDEEQEKILFLEYQENNDLDAVQSIIMSHLRFVAYIARIFKGYGFPMEDLVQEGTIGLMKSVKKFNLNFGVRLASFAVHYIKAEIQEYIIRNWRMVKATTTKARRKLFYNLRKLKGKTEWLTHQERQHIADQLNVSEEDISDMEVQLSQPDIYVNSTPTNENEPVSTDTSIAFEDKSEHFTLTLAQKDFNDKAMIKVKEAIATLDERSKDIIKNRWLCENKKTHKYFSEKYGVSQERIRQIEESALKKIRARIGCIELS